MRRPAPLLAALLLAANALPAAAIPLPTVMAEAGKSFAVESEKGGVFDQGGFATALSLLWPVEDFLRIGLSGFADDLGSLEAERFDHSTNPPSPLGLFELAHANVFGGAWRMEVVGPRMYGFDTFARGDWGAYWFRVDQQGDVLARSEKVGWSLGGGLMFPLREGHDLGLTIAYDRVFSDFTRSYMSANFAWLWRPGIHSQAAGARH